MVVLDVDGVRLSLEKDGRKRFYGKVEIPPMEGLQSRKIEDKKHFSMYVQPKKQVTEALVFHFDKRYRMSGGRYDTSSNITILYEDDSCSVELVMKPKLYVSPSMRKFNHKKRFSTLTIVPRNPRSSPPRHPQYVNGNIRRPYQGGCVAPK